MTEMRAMAIIMKGRKRMFPTLQSFLLLKLSDAMVNDYSATSVKRLKATTFRSLS